MLMVFLNTLCNFSVRGLENTPQNNTNSAETKQVPTELKDLKIEIQKLQELIKKENSKGTLISKSSSVLQKINSIFTFVVEKADKLLSKKFIIATLLVLAPAVTIYCTFFDITPLQNLFYSASSQTAEKAAELGAPIVAGAVTGTAKAILNDKVTVAEVVGIWAGYEMLKKVIEKIAEKGAPYIIDKLITCSKFFPFVYGKAKLLHRG